MKNRLTTLLCMLITVIGYATAQNYVIDNFENGKVNFTSSVNVNPDNSGRFEVLANPDNSGENKTANCWKYTRLTISDDWAGFWSMLSTPFNTAGYKYLHIKYYRTNMNSNLRILFEGNGFKREFLPMSGHASTTTGVWENLVYDLEAEGVSNVNVTVFGIQPDFSTNRVSGTTVYIDEIILSTSITGEGGFTSFIPKNLKAQNVTGTTLDLTWSALQDATSYDVYQNDVLLQNVTGTSLAVTGLEGYGLYKFYVVAKNAASETSQPSVGVYAQTPESKSNRDARMAWWREARFGMFIHWGGYATYAGYFDGLNVDGNLAEHPYSRPRYTGDGAYYSEWIMFGARIPRDTYQAKVKTDFTAVNYNPAEWVKLAKDAGMKYIIITSKHHEGLSLFDTHAGWNVLDHSAAGRDLLDDLVKEARKEGLKIGFYYSQALDWNNEGGMGWMPQNDNGRGGEWSLEKKTSYVDNIVVPHVQTIINKYAVDVIWWDMGEPKHPELQYKTLKAVKDITGAKNIILNDRLDFKIDEGKSGDFLTPEQSIPDVPVTGRADGRDWETCMTMNANWGYCAPDIDNQWKSPSDLILKLIDIASKGGNYLLNVGPDAKGVLPQESIDRLRAVGQWMAVNGEAIYGTIANPIDKVMPWGKITRKVDNNGNVTLYLHVAQWPSNGQLAVSLLNSIPESIEILGNPAILTTEQGNNQLLIKGLPVNPENTISTTIKLIFNGTPALGENMVMPDNVGKLSLLPNDAKVEGGICVEGDPGMRNFGCWASAAIGGVNGKITWKIQVAKDDIYEISANLHSTKASQLNFKVGENMQSFFCAAGNGYGMQTLGTMRLNAGVYYLELTRTATVSDWSYINLLGVFLTPTETLDVNPVFESNIQVYPENGNVIVTGLEAGFCIQLYDVTGRLFVSKMAQNAMDYVSANGLKFAIVKVMDMNGAIRGVKKITL